MPKNIFKIIIFFAAGIMGGIFADQVLWPYVGKTPLASISALEQQPIYANEAKEIIIKENDALERAVEKAEKTVIAVKSVAKNGEILEGSGIIITSDGLIVTLNELVPQGAAFHFYVNGQAQPFQILKRDSKENLVLVKLEKSNLPTAGFADAEKMNLGEKVFLAGFIFENGSPQVTVNEGIIRRIGAEFIQTTIFEKDDMKGSALFDIEGNILGINNIDKDGRIICVPIFKIREISGL